ncbi:MAG TPA: CPBP family intramembrane glutamic endopeptidase [Candidatus Saccharimonadales bacterium]|jgi:membrane protease YdiL (CAAX protease family)|nr:CPBP family intramembrane glutamic endopeptidase [Candidatus Saccharimonadales bacterium]
MMELQAHDPAHPPELLRTIFLNPRGLRAGWRLAIFVPLVIVIVVLFSLPIVLKFGSPSPGASPGVMLALEMASFLAVAAANWIMGRIEGRSMSEYGLPLRNASALSRFAVGYILWGFLPLSLLLLALRGLGAFYFGGTVMHGIAILHWAALWGLVFLFVGLFEEYAIRGYALYTLADGIGYWPAAIILAALFARLHAGNPGESRLGIIMTGAFALFASITLRRTGSLWLAVGAHAGWDWGQSFFYGVADSGLQVKGHLLNPRIEGPEWLSGGTVGPEGSALVLVLMVMMSVLVVVLYREPTDQKTA